MAWRAWKSYTVNVGEATTLMPLFGDVTQPSPISAGLFQRHQSEIARNLLPTLKSLCFPNDQHKGQRGEWADTGMSHQSLRFRALFCLLLDGLTQFCDSRVQSIQQLQQIAASPAGPLSQPKRLHVPPSVLPPQPLLTAQSI